MGMTYNYDTGKISRDWVFKKTERSCKRDPDKTVLIGVMCQNCPFYQGIRTLYKDDNDFMCSNIGTFVLCKYHEKDDDVDGIKDAIAKMYHDFREEAITHYYD